VNEVKLAVAGHTLRQRLGGFEVVAGVNGANRVGIFVSYVHNPNGNFSAFVILVGLWTVEENTAPACGWLVGGRRNRHGQRASRAHVSGPALGFFLGRGVHLGKFRVAHFAGVFAFTMINGKFHIELSVFGSESFPGRWAGLSPPHTSLKASVKSVTDGGPACGARTKPSGVAAAAGATLDVRSSPLSRRWAASGRIVASGHSGAQLSGARVLQELRCVAEGVGRWGDKVQGRGDAGFWLLDGQAEEGGWKGRLSLAGQRPDKYRGPAHDRAAAEASERASVSGARPGDALTGGIACLGGFPPDAAIGHAEITHQRAQDAQGRDARAAGPGEAEGATGAAAEGLGEGVNVGKLIVDG